MSSRRWSIATAPAGSGCVFEVTSADGGTVVARDGASEYRPARNIVEQDYFPEIETLTTGEHVETGFLDWILKRKIGLGSNVNEARLAIELGISNTSVREFLIRLSTFGFIRKEPHRQWVLNGFSEQYASELLHTRRLFEPDGAARLADNNDDPVQRARIDIIRQRRFIRSINYLMDSYS